VGDTCSPGDSLTKEFTQIHLNQLEQKQQIAGILIPKKYLGVEYFYGIAFINRRMPIFKVLVLGDEGKEEEQSRFYVGGSAKDVELFWVDFEKHCKQRKTSVNEVIELCADGSSHINPYRFFAEHIGRYHFTILAIDYVGSPTELTLDHLPLRKLMPPWSALLIQQRLTVELEADVSGISDSDILLNSSLFIDGNHSYSPGGNIYVGVL
jgi:hypothetical protein